LRDEFVDVAQRSVRRTLLDPSPFRRSQLAFESIEQAIEDIALTVIERRRLAFTALLAVNVDIIRRTGEANLRAFSGE
jgi:hypothetical protein